MQNRQEHQQEVRGFLQKHISNQPWDFTLPTGTGHETYFAHRDGQECFIKLGAHVERYQAVASMDLAPPVLATGSLSDGTTILVQPLLAGHRPSRKDYRLLLPQFATTVRRVHHSDELKQVLPKVASDLYSQAGIKALDALQQKWERYQPQVPDVAGFVDESLGQLRQQILDFQGAGLVASHNDICNGNWLVSADGRLYLLDLESMSLDDPALDIGATLWWYYPPHLREEFLTIVGYQGDAAFKKRMQVRMSMHCLHIILPREGSFDEFESDSFGEWLVDFRAVFAGEENPQGYD